MNMKSTLLYSPFMHLQTIGIISANNLERTVFLFLCFLSTFYIIYDAIVIVQLTYMQNNAFDFVDNAEQFGAYTQILGKTIIMIYYRKKIYHLIMLSKYFWKHDATNVKQITTYVTILQKVISILFPITALAAVASTILKTRSLPLGSWQIQNQHELYLVIITSMVISLPMGVTLIAFYDNLYLGFCFEIAIQFNILCARVQELSVEKINTNDDLMEYFNKLKYLIQHHNFLLSYLKEIKTIYSGVMMLEYVTLVPLIFSELYAFTETDSVAMLIKYGSGITCLLIQLSLYCLTADFVSYQVSKVPIAIYNSDWYSKYYKILKAPLRLFIQAAQEDIQFTACGLIKIDANSLVQVLRMVTSTITIVRNMKN